MTYEEPGFATAPQTGGPLHVSWIVPVGARATGHSGTAEAARSATETLIGDLARTVRWRPPSRCLPSRPTTWPPTGARPASTRSRLGDLTSAPGPDQLIAPSYVPIDVTAMAGRTHRAAVSTQVARGTQVLRAAALRPATGTWVDTNTDLSTADLGNFTSGLEAASTTQSVVSDDALASTNDSSNFTFAQPFTLTLAHGSHVPAVATTTAMDSALQRASRQPGVGGQSTLGRLVLRPLRRRVRDGPAVSSFSAPRWMAPQIGLRHHALQRAGQYPGAQRRHDRPVVAQVPVGGNNEPTTRHLQSGAGIGNGGFTPAAAARIHTRRRPSSTRFPPRQSGTRPW